MSDQAIYKLYPQVVSINAGTQAFDAQGRLVEIDFDLVNAEDIKLIAQAKLDSCKTEAKKRIATTDWAVLPDVGLANVAAFETYRAALRELIKNPVAEPTWPTEPAPIWS